MRASSGDRHSRAPRDLLPSTFFSSFLSHLPPPSLALSLESPPIPRPQLPYQGPASLLLLSSSPGLSNGLWLTVPLVFSKPVRKLLAFPTDVRVARKVFMQQSQQTLFRLHHAAQHVAAPAVVKLSISKHLLHVSKKLLHRAVAPTGTLALHCLEVHGVGNDVIVVLSLISGHGLPGRRTKWRGQRSLEPDRNLVIKRWTSSHVSPECRAQPTSRKVERGYSLVLRVDSASREVHFPARH